MKMNIFKKLPQAMVRVIATGALLVATALGSVVIGAGVASAGAPKNLTAVTMTPGSLASNATSTWDVTATVSAVANTDAIVLTLPGNPANYAGVTGSVPQTGFTVAATPTVTLLGVTGCTAGTATGVSGVGASTTVSFLVTTAACAGTTTVLHFTVTGITNPGAGSYAATGFSVTDNAGTSAGASAVVISGALSTPVVSSQPQQGAAIVTFTPDQYGTSFRVSNVDLTTAGNGGTQTCDVVLSVPDTTQVGQPCTLVGLHPGDAYEFFVTPTNDGIGLNTVSVWPSTNTTGITINQAIGGGANGAGTSANPYADSAVSIAAAQTVFALRAGDSLSQAAVIGDATHTMMWVSWPADGYATSYQVQAYSTGNASLGSTRACVVSTGAVLTGRQGCMVRNLTAGTQVKFLISPNQGDTAGSAVYVLGTPDVPANAAIQGYVVSTGGGNATVYVPTDGVASTYVVDDGVLNGDTCTITQDAPTVGLASCGLNNGDLSGAIGFSGTTITITASGNGTYSQDNAGGVANTALSSTALTAPTVTAGAITGNYASLVVTMPADGVASTYTATAKNVATGSTLSPLTGATATCQVANTVTAPSGSITCTIGGLATGTAYTVTYTISGNLDGGTSNPSNQISTLGSFSAASFVVLAQGAITASGLSDVGQQWLQVTGDGKATTYTFKAYQYSPLTGLNSATASAQCVQTFPTAPTTAVLCDVIPLTAGAYYDFTVTASGGTETNIGESAFATVIVDVVNNAKTYGSAVHHQIAGSSFGTVTAAKAAPNAYGDAATVSWTADGVASTYVVSVTGPDNPTATCTVSNTTTAPTGLQSCVIKGSSTYTGLTDGGTPYYFTVTPSGNSDSASAATSSTVFTASNALGAPSVTSTGSKSVNVGWTADGIAVGYTVYYGLSSGSTPYFGCGFSAATAPTGAQSCSITGLTNGVMYYFDVVPSGGYSTVSTAVPYTVGSTVLAAPVLSWSSKTTTSNPAVTITFAADGVANLYTVILYEATPTPGLAGICTTGNSITPLTGTQSCTISSGLFFGHSYVATVSASGNGDTAATSPLSGPVPFIATPFTAPGAPAVTATALTSTTVSVAWTAPVVTGGSIIAGYLISGLSADGVSALNCGAGALAAGTVVCTGAKPGTTYKISVYAGGPFGNSAAGTASVTTPAATLLTVGASFTKGTAKLTASAKSALTSLVSSLHDGASITIRGWGATKALATARANAVASFIMSSGAAVHTTVIGIVSKASDAKVYQTA